MQFLWLILTCIVMSRFGVHNSSVFNRVNVAKNTKNVVKLTLQSDR